ncbi:MAG TPA: terminase family protein [Verrucomicrobiae bacterium]|jgi:phage FluMu gp28-like protein
MIIDAAEIERQTPTKERRRLGSQLLPYQRDWANDHSRWKFGLMARQVGKDFASGYEGIRECVEADLQKKKITWLIAAPSERQSLESLQKWKYWAEAFHAALAGEEIERDAGSESLLSSATITFPHGSRVVAVPGKPDTVRGFSANVLLTEFAFFEQPDATWRAILPSITNSKSGGVKKVRLITTPNGLGNKAHDLWVKNFKEPKEARAAARDSLAQWSCHLIDIHSAVRQGLPVDIEELKAALDDPEGWAQEFECQFLDVQSVLLPYELIAACESAEAIAAAPADFWQGSRPWPLVMGLDFGRRQNLTVAWVLARMGDVWQTVEVLELDKMPTDQQVEILRPRIRHCGRVCLDYTGPGVGLGDYLAKEFRPYEPEKHQFGKIELCNFSSALKVDIFSKLRMAFENRGVRVPVSRVIREDLHSVNRVSSPNGQITYRAPHCADGHADRCTALALALRAGGSGPVRMSAESVPRRFPANARPGETARNQCPL